MNQSSNISSPIACPLCKRDITTGHLQPEEGLLYCYGCNYEFSAKQDLPKSIEEIAIPEGIDALRFRIINNNLEIKISWFKYFDFKSFIWNQDKMGLIGAIGLIFNKTTITANRNLLVIKHKPFEYLPFVRYAKSYIRQFFVKEVEGSELKALISVNDTILIGLPTMTVYGLYAKVRTEEEKLLLWNLKKPTLLFIEQEIERVMGIKNDPLLNEMH